MLEKLSVATFVPGSPGVQADPGVPAHPAYCATETVSEERFVVDQVSCTPSDSLEAGTAGVICLPSAGHYETTTSEVTTCYPATAGRPPVAGVPATPAQWLTDHQIGWNAGAHSVKRPDGDVQASFKVPAASGIIVGFNHVSLGVGFGEITHGIFFRQGVARVYESGAAKGEVLGFLPTDTFRIERVNGTVSYYKEGALFYQSATLSTADSLIVDASLYSGGDRID